MILIYFRKKAIFIYIGINNTDENSWKTKDIIGQSPLLVASRRESAECYLRMVLNLDRLTAVA